MNIKIPFAIVVDCDIHIPLEKLLNKLLDNHLVSISSYARAVYKQQKVLEVFKVIDSDEYICWGLESVERVNKACYKIYSLFELYKMMNKGTTYGEIQ